MGEGLSADEVGKELAEHAKHAGPAGYEAGGAHDRRDRTITIAEATILAIVAVLAAWSGYSSAKWSTESRLLVAQAATARTEASRARLTADETKNFDASTFNAWFSAYVAGNPQAMDVAARRFRPEFRVAFDAWIVTDPAHNPDAPPGPTYMPEYSMPGDQQAEDLDAHADELYAEGAAAGGHADDYVRITVYLATVLFLVGISGHFRVRGARLALVAVGSAILVYAVVLLAVAPKPPS